MRPIHIFFLALTCGLLAGCPDDNDKPKTVQDVGGDLRDTAADSGSDLPNEDVGNDLRSDAGDAGVDVGMDMADMADDPPLDDGWFAMQTVIQRPYTGQNTSGRWHSTTLAVDFFPQAASPDDVCAATLTGYAFVIQAVDQLWPVTGMNVTVVDNNQQWLDRPFVETVPGVWVVEFADAPVAIEDTAIGARILNVDIDRPADFGGSSTVTIAARFEGIQRCDLQPPRLRAVEEPIWDAPPILADGLLARAQLLTPFDVDPQTYSPALLGIDAGSLGWYSVGTSLNPRCGEVTEVWATLNRRRSQWESTSMTVDVEDNNNAVISTATFTEVMPDQWQAVLNPSVVVNAVDRRQLRIYADEGGFRDRFMFRNFWVKTAAPVGPCQ